MAVRLAFAVAAHLDADILLVDEVLAVGDQAFQDKCLGKIREVRQHEGRTVLFVSHNLAAVASLCSRALLLSAGRVIADASASEITQLYTAGVAMATTTAEVDLTELPRAKGKSAHFTAVQVCAVDNHGTVLDAISSGSIVEVVVTVTAPAAVVRALLIVEVMDERGRPAIGISTDSVDGWIDLVAGETRRIRVRMRDVQVRPGIYSMGLTLTTVAERLDELDAVVRFEVTPAPDAGYDRWPGWPAAAYAPRFDVAIV
jgi:lipopolysaccharide transport system ATP-binding protein